MKSESEGDSGRKQKLAIGILAMVLLTFAVYVPILPGNFLMDDVRLLGSDNPLINGQLTPSSLWFQTDFTLATFGWWVERLLFGNDPAGYHVVNITLHAISAVLFWRLLARLKIPGAWLAGALFAVHPVCAREPGRDNAAGWPLPAGPFRRISLARGCPPELSRHCQRVRCPECTRFSPR